MIKIDIHTHIIPRDLPRFAERFGYEGFLRLDHHKECSARLMRDDGTYLREIDDCHWDPVVRLRDCDQRSVDVQVLSTVPMMFSYWAKPRDALEVCRFINNHLAEVTSRHKKRFVGLATLPLQDPELACRELERSARELKLAGIQIGSHVNEWNLDDPSLLPVFELADRLGVAVFVHPWDPIGMREMRKYWLSWLVGMPAEVNRAVCSMIFGGVFEKFPDLRVAFAFGGGTFIPTLGIIDQGFRARPDLCAAQNPVSPSKYLGKFWVDSLLHDPGMLRLFLNVLGVNKICMGSDYPFPLGEAEPGYLIESLGELKAEEKELLLGQNALTWLGMREIDFVI